MDSYLQYRTTNPRCRAVDRAVAQWCQPPASAARIAQIANDADAAVLDVTAQTGTLRSPPPSVGRNGRGELDAVARLARNDVGGQGAVGENVQ